jgi:hypothetical protein
LLCARVAGELAVEAVGDAVADQEEAGEVSTRPGRDPRGRREHEGEPEKA